MERRHHHYANLKNPRHGVLPMKILDVAYENHLGPLKAALDGD